MADMMSTLKTLLGDNADDKIKNAMNMLQNSGILTQPENSAQAPAESAPAQPQTKNVPGGNNMQNGTGANSAGEQLNGAAGNIQQALTPEGLQFLAQMKSMVDQISNTNDSRSNLLRSLRPFMRADRQRTIDRAIRIMNIGRFSGLFGR